MRLILNAGTSSEARAGVAIAPPVGARGEDGNEPEESTGEVNPDSVLHAHDVSVAVGLLLDVNLYGTCQRFLSDYFHRV